MSVETVKLVQSLPEWTLAMNLVGFPTDEKKTHRKFQERFRVFESIHPKFCYPLT